jgi:hypothetical protein
MEKMRDCVRVKVHDAHRLNLLIVPEEDFAASLEDLDIQRKRNYVVVAVARLHDIYTKDCVVEVVERLHELYTKDCVVGVLERVPELSTKDCVVEVSHELYTKDCVVQVLEMVHEQQHREYCDVAVVVMVHGSN